MSSAQSGYCRQRSELYSTLTLQGIVMQTSLKKAMEKIRASIYHIQVGLKGSTAACSQSSRLLRRVGWCLSFIVIPRFFTQSGHSLIPATV